VVINLFVTDIQ